MTIQTSLMHSLNIQTTILSFLAEPGFPSKTQIRFFDATPLEKLKILSDEEEEEEDAHFKMFGWVQRPIQNEMQLRHNLASLK